MGESMMSDMGYDAASAAIESPVRTSVRRSRWRLNNAWGATWRL